MKYNVQSANAVSNNTNTSLDFKIGDAAVVIDILRNRLYSDKIRVVVQEYLSNARDAMRECGNTKDHIEVTLPTSKKPVLTIRDFGPGLSVERVGEVFVQFGKSTKRASETQTGGFGLGGKSAFAYTDSFTVISIHDGIETHYVAHIGKNSVGSLDQVYQGKTKAKSGVEIQIGVNKTENDEGVTDIARFNSMVFRTIAFWSEAEMPVISNEHDAEVCEYANLYYALQDKDRGFRTDKVVILPPAERKSNQYYYGNSNDQKPYLVIDGIIYDLDKNYKSKDLQALDNAVIYESVIYVLIPAGKLEISASREAIAVNQANNAVLDKAMSDSFDAIIKKSLKIINAVETIDDVKTSLEQLWGITGVPRDLKRKIQGITIDFQHGHLNSNEGYQGYSNTGNRRKSISTCPASLDAFFVHNNDELAESTVHTKLKLLVETRGLSKFVVIPKDMSKQAEILGAIAISSLKAERTSAPKQALPEGKVNIRVFDDNRPVTEYSHVDTTDLDGVTYVLIENSETREQIMEYYALQTLISEHSKVEIKFAFPSRATMKSIEGLEGFVKREEFFTNLTKYIGEKGFNELVKALKQLHVTAIKDKHESLYELAIKTDGIVDAMFVKNAKVIKSVKLPKSDDSTPRWGYRNRDEEKPDIITDKLVKTVFDNALSEVAALPEFAEYVKLTYPLVGQMYGAGDEMVHYVNGKYASLQKKAV